MVTNMKRILNKYLMPELIYFIQKRIIGKDYSFIKVNNVGTYNEDSLIVTNKNLDFLEESSFLHIDMNCVYPEAEALKYFWDKLVKGGMVIFDDYGWAVYYEQKQAHDLFAESKGVKIVTLPTGQGLLIKPF